jgi:hypothetical protein
LWIAGEGIREGERLDADIPTEHRSAEVRIPHPFTVAASATIL